MSKVSEAKAAQGYTKEPAKCSTPLRRIKPPIEPWSALIYGSMYAAWQQVTAEDTKPEFDGYFGRPDNDDPET